MRLLFQNRDLATLLQWVSLQWVYIGLAAVSVLFFLIVRFEGRGLPRWAFERTVLSISRIVILITWAYAILRLGYGPPGNVLSTLLPFGEAVSLAGGIVAFVLPFWVMMADFQLERVGHAQPKQEPVNIMQGTPDVDPTVLENRPWKKYDNGDGEWTFVVNQDGSPVAELEPAKDFLDALRAGEDLVVGGYKYRLRDKFLKRYSASGQSS